ncbi:MAG: response regulator [Kovacikia sp.]
MKKILVIEDDFSIRESILELLEVEGFDVISAENGNEGLQAVKEHPDLILCDVVMPQLDGYGVLSALRRNPATAIIPFIFLTAKNMKEYVRQGMGLGADDYLFKPFTAQELLKAITTRLNRQQTLVNQSQKQLESLRNSIALSLPHELRTPLNGILGLSELLKDDYEQLERQEIAEIAEGIHDAADRLHRLIQNYLLYVELELMTMDTDRLQALQTAKTYYPKVLIAKIATQIALKANRQADLYLNLQNTVVQISDLKLTKIVEELTENAFKFSKPGTPVTLIAEATHQGLTLSIIDQGRGMTAEQIASLGAYMQFERKFYEQQGSGLGLAISKRLVEVHGGELTIESIPTQQTRVQITLLKAEE